MALGDSFYAEIDVTVGTAASNSYASVAESDDYHDGMVATFATDWDDAATTELKEDALMWATRQLDLLVAWDGTKTITTLTNGLLDQALRWPRIGVESQDGELWASDAIPVWLKEATCEMARGLLVEDRTAEPLRNISRLKADTVEIVFDKTDLARILVRSVRHIIEPYGDILEGQASLEIERV